MSRRYEKDLPVRLTATETAEKSRELANKSIRAAHVETKIEDIKSEAKDQIKMLKETLAELRGQVKELAHSIRKGEIVRPVLVEARVATDNSKAEIIRLDTGEVVEERPLTEDDRQMELEEVLARIEADTKITDAKSRAAGERDDEDDEDEEPEAIADANVEQSAELEEDDDDGEDLSG